MQTRARALILTLTLGLGIIVAGCSGGEDLSVKPVIGDGDQYKAVLEKGRELSKDPLEKLERGEDLNDKDKQSLTAAATQFQALVDFDGSKFATHLVLGQIYLELDNTELANEHFLLCLGNLPKTEDGDVLTIGAEARCGLAQARYKVGNFEDALTEIDQAIKAFDKNPKYLVTRAEILSELGRTEEAKLALEKALKINPDHPRGKRLLNFLKKAQ